MNPVLPFSATMSFGSGDLTPHEEVLTRRLSEMPGAFADASAQAELIAGGDPVVYRAYTAPIPEESSQLIFRTTIVAAGRVGDEYFMTKGHHHHRDSAEFYLGMSGEGLMLLQHRNGEMRTEKLAPNVTVYVPPGWAHRTVNTSTEDLVFLAVYFGDAGHDYESIERGGFGAQVIATEQGPQVITATRS